MTARLRKLASDLADAFWLLPALLVLTGIAAAIGLVEVDRSQVLPSWLLKEAWLYTGGATGARTLLGAVASSTISVVGTVFSITIAALSLAAGQMGPRLLRNFTRDRGNQFTLGIFLGTFSYALVVLRTIRAETEGEFVPHLALTVAVLLAFVCVGMLVYFVGHMAGRINVDTVIRLVSDDVRGAIRRLATDEPDPSPPPASLWAGGQPIAHDRRGYLQHLDCDALADWACEHGTAIRLLVRPGSYVFPGAPVAVMVPAVGDAAEAVYSATALGSERISHDDLEYAVRQLVEVAVRALSPGINDPHTAISALNELGAALCSIAGKHLPTGVYVRKDRPVLVVPAIDYDGLTDAMFHQIRQSAAGSPPVLIRLLEVLTAVASCERDPARVHSLRRHADLVLADAERSVTTPADLADARRRYVAFASIRERNLVPST